MTLDYQSRVGDFDQHFYERNPEEEYAVHRVGVGLFSWLRPFDTLEWESGACAGYNQLQREVIVDQLFEMLRIAGILAVVISVSCFLFSLSIACLSFSNIQRYILVIAALLMSALTGSSLMITRSGVCTQVGTSPNCSIDQGGLVAIAGVVCWMLTFLVAIFFVQPVHRKKLSPKMAEKRKKEHRKRQLEMIEELEAIELEKQMKHCLAMKNKRNRSDGSMSTDVSSPPSSPARRQSTSPESSSPREIIHHLPSSTMNATPSSPHVNRKHKQLESPQVSPNRSNSQCDLRTTASPFSTSENPASHQDEVEAIYRQRARPIKKRRLRGDSHQAIVDNQIFSGGEGSKGVPKSSQMSSRAYAKDKRTPAGLLPQRSLNTSNTTGSASRGDNQSALPLFMSRDVSTVINERVVNQDVEVFIADVLDKIDDIIDDDEENAIDKSNTKYEL